jgi:hypothetical protein
MIPIVGTTLEIIDVRGAPTGKHLVVTGVSGDLVRGVLCPRSLGAEKNGPLPSITVVSRGRTRQVDPHPEPARVG